MKQNDLVLHVVIASGIGTPSTLGGQNWEMNGVALSEDADDLDCYT